MILCLFRHGHAVDEAVRDDWRTLTEQGRHAAYTSASTLKEKLPAMSTIFSSPLARAIETATLAAQALDHHEALQITPLLQPGGNVSTVVEWLEHLSEPHVLMVSHEPILSNLVSLLTGQGARPFAKAEIIALERVGGKWRRMWSITPQK